MKKNTHWVLIVQDAWSRNFVYEDYTRLLNDYGESEGIFAHHLDEESYKAFCEAFNSDMEFNFAHAAKLYSYSVDHKFVEATVEKSTVFNDPDFVGYPNSGSTIC